MNKNFLKILIYFLFVFNLISFVKNQSFYISPVRLTNNCRENEVFTNCGSACDATCENVTITRERKLNNYEPYVILDQEPDCKYNCIPGCFCRKPLYRNRFGECVDEEQCKKNFNRNEFIEELNKFLNLNFNELNSEELKNSNQKQTNYPNNESNYRPTNQKYISVNDNSESSSLNTRTGYPSTRIQLSNNQDFLNIEKDFLNNFFDDIFNLPKQQIRQTNYNNNFKTTTPSNDYLESLIEKEADIIIKQISNGLKIKKFIIETIRSLVNRSQYNGIGQPLSFINEQKDDTKNGLITTK